MPPFLLGMGVIFWGWQTGFLWPAIFMAAALESPRWVRERWDFSDEDFSRIWIFCAMLFLAAAVYAFTSNDGPADFRGLFENPNFFTQRNAGTASARTAAALIRWVPFIFFLFVAAQVFSAREGIPLQTISLILRRRWKQAQKNGLPPPPQKTVNVSYPYFGLCLFAATAHGREDDLYFWGLCLLVAWALWSRRSVRFNPAIWVIALGVAVALGYAGQRTIVHWQHYFEGINAQWLAGFSRRSSDPSRGRTSMGQIGRIKTSSTIVIRLDPKNRSGPPPLLREASYRTYKNQTWDSGFFRNETEIIYGLQTNKDTYVLVPEKTNTGCARISCYLDRGKGLLPVASGSGRLEHLPVYSLNKNKSGALMAEGPGLIMFDDYYGPGETIDSIPDWEDKWPPERELPAIRKVVEELQLTGQTLEEKLRAVNRFFQSKFNYSTWQEQPESRSRTNETPLARFLLKTRKGHCEYFATATVLLLRHLGIPARYAVGYAVHEASGSKYIVRQRDAHAWCLVWNEEKHLWQDFDTTPSSWIRAEKKASSPLQVFSDVWSRIRYEFAKLRWGQYGIRQYLIWLMVPVLVLLFVQIVVQSRRRRQNGKQQEDKVVWPGLDSEFYHLELRLAARGLRRETGEPLFEWLSRVGTNLVDGQSQKALQEVLNLHYRYRFDPEGLSRPERQRLRQQSEECVRRLKRF